MPEETKLHDWQKEFKLKSDLVQIDVEKFLTSLSKQTRISLLRIHGHGATLRAAIESGWIIEPDTEVGDFEGEKRYFYNGKNIDEIHAGAVKWIGEKIDKAYQEATEVPKNL